MARMIRGVGAVVVVVVVVWLTLWAGSPLCPVMSQANGSGAAWGRPAACDHDGALRFAAARRAAVLTASEELEDLQLLGFFGEASAPVLNTRPIAGPVAAIHHVAGLSQRALGGRLAGLRVGDLLLEPAILLALQCWHCMSMCAARESQSNQEIVSCP